MRPSKPIAGLWVRRIVVVICTAPVSIFLETFPDVNRKDYRAWYGLGQAYELLNMHQYALYYYQHATSLRYEF